MPEDDLQATPLKPRYERFAREYVRNGGVAARAARLATESTNPGNLCVFGHRLLKRPDVQARIKELMMEEFNS